MKNWKPAAICLLVLLCWGTAYALDPYDLPPYGEDAPPHDGTKAPTTETDVDNLDGTWTFTQYVDEASTPPNYLGPWYSQGGWGWNNYGFEYYSWYNQDYGWLHTFPHWNAAGLNVLSATLTIHAWDVDSETSHGYNGEYDGLHIDGVLLSPGYLQGTNNTWSTTIFNVPLSSITDDGDISSFLDIDMHHTSWTWATTVDYSRLEITYSTGTTNDPPHQPVLDYNLTLIDDCFGSGPCAENGQDLVINVIGPTPADPDGDAVTYSYRWFVDEGTGGFVDDEFAGRGDHTGNTVPAVDILPEDIWQVQVTPMDEHGAVGNYATVTFPQFCPDQSGCNDPPVAICQNVTVNADANCEADASIDNGSYDPDGDPIILSQIPPGPYPLGQTTCTLIVTDVPHGAADTCVGIVTVVDNTPPVANCPGNITVGNDPGVCGAVVNFTATATDNCPGATIACVPPSGSYFPVGVTTVTCTATDAATNTDVCIFTVTVNDTEDPVANCPGNITVGNDPGQCDAVVNFAATATDNCPGVTISCTPVSGSYFPVGVATVTCIAVDGVGLADTCSFTVTVNDTEDPVATCPGNITVGNDPGVCDAVVNFVATVTDNCPGATIACTPASGNAFPVGVTTVTCIGTDAAGNADTCTFTITVNDIEPPVVVCQNDITVGSDPGVCGAIVDFLVLSATDNCFGVVDTANPASGSFFPLGITPVEVIATDLSGNADTCYFNITVTNSVPTCQVPDDTTIVMCEPEEVCLPVGCDDADDNLLLTSPSIISGPGSIVNGEWCYTPDCNETVSVTIRCEDKCQAFCEATFEVTFRMVKITIEKTHNTLQGHFEEVSITMEGDIEMGGFDFLIAYDASALTPTEVTPGQLLEDCDWEYFTYRYGADGNCGDACPSGLLRIIAIAETNTGSTQPPCFGPPDCDPHELAEMRFLVSNNRTFECQYVPIRFFWGDCGDNTISDITGDSLYVSDHVYEFEGTEITDSTYGFPTYFGVQEECLDNPDPGKPLPVRLICFVNGGVDIICADSIDAPGDININGVSYEIADAVMLTNYFVKGLLAFEHVEASVAASDVNADGIPLTVADLVYLIRVVVGDAVPYAKGTAIEGTYSHEGGVIGIPNLDVAAAYLVIEGQAEPELLVDGMDVAYQFDGERTRIIVTPQLGEENNPVVGISYFTGEFLAGINSDILTFEAATPEATQIILKDILPTQFGLSQNHPNPFNPVTTINFDLPDASDVTLVVYNLLGRKVATITSGHYKAGHHSIEWDAGDMASGIYLYQLEAGTYSKTMKMVLLK